MSRQLLPEGQGVEFDSDCLQVSLQMACQALAEAHLAGTCLATAAARGAGSGVWWGLPAELLPSLQCKQHKMLEKLLS